MRLPGFRAPAFLLVSSLLTASPAFPQGLSFFTNYFVTGDVIVSGVGVKGTGVGGFASSAIAIPASAVPPNATPIAAFLYWSTVVTQTNPAAGVVGAQFKERDLNSSVVTTILNPNGSSPCLSSGGGTARRTARRS
jgi:hypothetical protein